MITMLSVFRSKHFLGAPLRSIERERTDHLLLHYQALPVIDQSTSTVSLRGSDGHYVGLGFIRYANRCLLERLKWITLWHKESSKGQLWKWCNVVWSYFVVLNLMHIKEIEGEKEEVYKLKHIHLTIKNSFLNILQ